MSFEHQKRMILQRADKSKKGSWDERVVGLCTLINAHAAYVTLSSCSGRIMLLTQQDDNKKNLTQWMYITHDLASFADVQTVFRAFSRKDTLFFRQEGPILHVCCKTIDDAQILLDLGQTAGFKRTGIISARKKIVVELISSEQLFCPVFVQEHLVSDKYLSLLVQEANRKLKKSWDGLEKLSSSFKRLF